MYISYKSWKFINRLSCRLQQKLYWKSEIKLEREIGNKIKFSTKKAHLAILSSRNQTSFLHQKFIYKEFPAKCVMSNDQLPIVFCGENSFLCNFPRFSAPPLLLSDLGDLQNTMAFNWLCPSEKLAMNEMDLVQ